MKCNKCGMEISEIETSYFTIDGDDEKDNFTILEAPNNAVYFDIDANWCGYDLTEEEQMEQIECPFCHKFPFKIKEVQVHEIVRVVCFKE